MKAIIGIGTNIGDRYNNIVIATESLGLVPGIKVLRTSSVYETEPWGYTEQDGFYNSVVEVETTLTAEALLGVCLGIEAAMGRVRQFKYGPRIIDLDLLLYEGRESDTAELRLPHPLIGERDFVLVPMQELFEDMNIYNYIYKEEYENIAEKSSAKKVEKIENNA